MCKKLSDRSAGVVSYLQRGTNHLHVFRLLPLPPIITCVIKHGMVYHLDTALPKMSGKMAVKQVSVCVYDVQISAQLATAQTHSMWQAR